MVLWLAVFVQKLCNLKQPVNDLAAFDLVFIDADKPNYANYYDMIFPKLRIGGIILADNVLWSGKVLDTKANTDESTIALEKFNEKIQTDDRVSNILFAVRDGLMVIRKERD